MPTVVEAVTLRRFLNALLLSVLLFSVTQSAYLSSIVHAVS